MVDGFRIPMPNSEMHYKLMRLLESNPEMSQRRAARELGISLGKVNYCLQALVRKGWLKAVRFKNNQRKTAYLYFLTPRGIKQKASLTVQFLLIKTQEYEALHREIQQMRREVDENPSR